MSDDHLNHSILSSVHASFCSLHILRQVALEPRLWVQIFRNHRAKTEASGLVIQSGGRQDRLDDESDALVKVFDHCGDWL